MSRPEKKLTDLMVSLDEYVVVDEDATLTDALRALDRAGARMTDSVHRHKAVLVRNKEGRIVGKVGHLAFLQAMRAHDRFAHDPRLHRAGLDAETMRRSESVYRLLSENLSDLCAAARHIPAREAMHPISERIPHTASLLDALDAFLQWQTLSLLVIRKQRAIGVLRLVDLFDEIARTVQDCDERGKD